MRLDNVRSLARLRHDETLYSAMARLTVYLGSPPPGRLHDALFDSDVSILDSDLPCGLEAVVVSGVFGPADLHGAVREWTLFPYYTRYVLPGHAAAAERAMAASGVWPFEPIGGWSATLPPPDRLRFCLECREDMLAQHPDLWWRRSHQLPSVIVCPDHGAPLHASPIGRDRRRIGYVAASLELCPSSAEGHQGVAELRVANDLLVIARASDALLDQNDKVAPDDRRMDYLASLDRLNLLGRAGAADLSGLARAMDGYWGTTLDVWPGLRRDGRCGQQWLGRLLLSGRDAAPLHHLLLELMLRGRLAE